MSARRLGAGVSLARYAEAAMRSILQIGWAFLSRGNLRMQSSSRTAACPPTRIARWRWHPCPPMATSRTILM
eukprot:2668067-Pyramimonas_sp.AAC.1